MNAIVYRAIGTIHTPFTHTTGMPSTARIEKEKSHEKRMCVLDILVNSYCLLACCGSESDRR